MSNSTTRQRDHCCHHCQSDLCRPHPAGQFSRFRNGSIFGLRKRSPFLPFLFPGLFPAFGRGLLRQISCPFMCWIGCSARWQRCVGGSVDIQGSAAGGLPAAAEKQQFVIVGAEIAYFATLMIAAFWRPMPLNALTVGPGEAIACGAGHAAAEGAAPRLRCGGSISPTKPFPDAGLIKKGWRASPPFFIKTAAQSYLLYLIFLTVINAYAIL